MNISAIQSLKEGEQKEAEWNDLFSNYKKEFPELG